MKKNSLKKFNHLCFIAFAIFLELLFTSCPAVATLNFTNTISRQGIIAGYIATESSSVYNKTAFPTFDNTATYYYRLTTDDGTNQVDYDLGRLTPDASGNCAFSVKLPLGTYIQITAKAYTIIQVGGVDTPGGLVLQGSKTTTTTLSEESPFVSNLSFALKPVVTATGTGSINLQINLDTAIGITNIGITEIGVVGGITKNDLVSSSYTFTKNDVVAGAHRLLFSFFKQTGSSSDLLYQCQEVINVYDNMETNTWIKNGTSEYLKDDGSGNIEFWVTQDCVERFALSNIYVDTQASSDGTGSFFSPHDTISAAIEHAINASFPSDPDAVITIHIKDGQNETLDEFTGGTFAFNNNHKYVIESYRNIPGDRQGAATISLSKTDIPLFEVSGNLTLNGIYLGIIVQSSSPVVLIQGGGVLNMYDSQINRNPSSNGIELSGTSANKAVLNMKGESSVSNCSTFSYTASFGIKAVSYGDVNMYDNSSVFGCGTYAGGGSDNGCAGVYVGNNSTLTMNDSSDIHGNGNSNSGTAGGVVVANQGKLKVTGGRICNNNINPDVEIKSGGTVSLIGNAGKPIYLGYINDCSVNIEGAFTQLTEYGLTHPIFIMDSIDTSTIKLNGTSAVLTANYTKFAVKDIQYSFAGTGKIVNTPPAAQGFPAGENPVFPEVGRFKVESKENLEAIRKWCNIDGKSFKNIAFVLNSPIDFENAVWEPIGTASNPFNGTFDGGGKKIEGIRLENQQGTGFFGSIKNATIKNVTVHCVGTSLSAQRIGGLVGEVYGNSLIDSCSSEGSIMANSNAIGGIVGTVVDGNSVIRNCINNTAIITSGGSRVGGIVGDSLGTTETLKIENCANLAEINFGSNNWSSGGIIGFINSAQDNSVRIKNCINTGRIVFSSGTNYADIVGGTEGYKSPVIENCYYSKSSSLVGSGVNRTNCTILDQEAKFSYDSITEKYNFTDTNTSFNRFNTNDVIEALNAWVNAQTTPSNYRHWENEGVLIRFYD